MTYSTQEEANLKAVKAGLEAGSVDFTRFFAEIFTETTRWTIAGRGPVAGEYNGLKALHENAEKALFDRLDGPLAITPRGIWADGDDVIVRIDSSGRARDGRPYRNGYLYVLTMQEGVVVSGIEWLDLHAYYEIVERVKL
ncbi:nuclear transport factor 2 family protein [Kineosporia babensis]|uniref:Nuclear transport factor 2 family protein n=1 Tax=Kineosporia babensis TaxID=499548 RepID=A0A9X1NH35_9ACTN|nr:nuclear transport factor 2 family protein [Kineosporia babensis]MCD5314987.1 nuclear transport factor 2 family protein [Kineosporia babensis]